MQALLTFTIQPDTKRSKVRQIRKFGQQVEFLVSLDGGTLDDGHILTGLVSALRIANLKRDTDPDRVSRTIESAIAQALRHLESEGA